MAEAALAHAAGNAVTLAYRRGDAYDLRAEMMEDWAEFCSSPAPRTRWPGRTERMSGEIIKLCSRLSAMLLKSEDSGSRSVARLLQAFARSGIEK
ncbi:hypothetical protein [Limobrevibacterium gyesilva]|uniref:hypothetical protein n=1 Tax=Limobrevibacterium gyesilva TaxID=2991712 RepID=UPI00222770AE|nr:hypothetical protein [Limobrevibacterium gyesilva]